MNIKLGTYFGIPLRLNIFTLLFIFYVYYTTPTEQMAGDVYVPYLNIIATGMFCILLFFVVLHEYGHCLMAKLLGWEVDNITLYPIGGMARMGFRYSKPTEELLVTLAGPMVNVFLAIIFGIATFLIIYFDGDIIPIATFITLTTMNVLMVIFNMLPIFPMDGGRVLRAILSYKLGHRKATWLAVKIAQVLGLLIILATCYYGYFFTAIVLGFVLFKSQAETTDADMISSILAFRKNVADTLNNPVINDATLSELITIVDAESNKEALKNLNINRVLPILLDCEEGGLTI